MAWKWCALAAALLLSVVARAETELSEADIDALAQQPGTEVTRTQEGDTQSIQIHRAGVVVSIQRKGNQTQTVGQDNSGHGAVLCMWKFYIGFRQGLNQCFPGQYPEFREDLDYAIGAMNDFIVANSLSPTSKAEVEAAVAALEARGQKQFDDGRAQLGAEELQKRCGASNFGQMIVKMTEMTREQRRRQIVELLSVPRPPVMNPCIYTTRASLLRYSRSISGTAAE
jgi:hypothetical protein